MYFKQATLDDLDTIIDILSDGRNQLAEAGVNQWQGDYPSRKQITADIMQGAAYLFNADDNATVGAVAVVPSPDATYDTADATWLNTTDPYVVIHRVAIHSSHAGHGYATQLFEKIIAHITKEHPEIKSIRIDTHTDNMAMQHLIAKMNFERVGKMDGVYHPDDACFVYEKIIR
ncbi:GNAT family N-acetyltransferase [Lactiplantibacillus fabifermentans]|uniref:Acetyltransferase n=2 Tax=Lactiplantibacillus fabifermentans TaxID=483011 RepID=A0A0R2NPZ7_9LACO|nr:GNAT family N-acetyltransferase [Lactiplantibacillus fabifermentans]ETY74654.1 GNAT family acetyltransferase [Lactiplantibacillus fabifermentans T30PCM01]KRO26093.1 acetyltransferase [Lactiplantibacillus fabifermentans DSM 21115]